VNAPRRNAIGKLSTPGFEKSDNNPQAHDAKVKLRGLVLEHIPDPRVFDAFAGAGAMYSAVWHKALAYTGCDQKPQSDQRLMFCADNRRVLRAIDLKPFNIFDLDAYGFPWDQAIIIRARRPIAAGELLGFCFTEAGGIMYKANGVPHAVTLLAGIKAGSVGLGRARHAIFERTLAGFVRGYNCDIVKRWQAVASKTANGKASGNQTIYCGVVLRGRG
jgi:hypothetical protein